ncbi:MAG TPA: RnfABCDGE type electron transport complex subunit D [Gammaproteobacteria bacterium]
MTTLISSPHVHAPLSVQRMMLDVMLALLPSTLFGVWLFGWPALNVLLLGVAAALVSEAMALWLAGKPLATSLTDGSAALTGWLLALSLPPWTPWWIAVLGSAFAIFIGKQLFGGIGQNIFNPAMLARVALLISFPVELTFWVAPHPLTSPNTPGFLESLAITFQGVSHPDAISGATLLGHVKTELGRGVEFGQALPDAYSLSSISLGTMSGSLGETSALLLLLGGLYLLVRRVISWHTPAAMLVTLAALSAVMHLIDPSRYATSLYHLLSGGVMLGAFFIATDPVTSPSTPRGQLLYGAALGALVYVIRTFGGYPEGVAFAVLIMNAMSPLIDHYLRPRIYGRDRRGKPLSYPQEERR